MGASHGMLHRKHNHCNLKASQTALSTMLSLNSPCQSISVCACDVSGSRNPLHKRSIACWLRIHEKMTKHANRRLTHCNNHRKTFACGPRECGVTCLGALDVAWSMQIALFQLGPEENIGLSVCLRKQKLRLEARGNWAGCRQ